MFPNQDTLPTGGFGNLIALPLQHQPRQNDNSIFVDENFIPYPDQWLYLSQIKKITKGKIDKVIKETHLYHRLHVLINENTNDQVKMPAKIEVFIKNGIYIPKVDLPSNLISKLIKLATFNNPEFYKAQAKRLPTYKIPRIIDCTDDQQKYIILPRGCMADLKNLCDENSIELTVKDQTQSGLEISKEFHGQLRIQQDEAVKNLIKHPTGILSATTGFGKTVVAASLISRRKVNTLIIVHRKQLIQQWKESLVAFYNINQNEIGQIGGGKNAITGNVDIATIQSLNRNGTVKDCITQYGQIIVDECHHISAYSFEQVLKKANAKYVHGLTATPTRKDGLHPIMTMQCGRLHLLDA